MLHVNNPGTFFIAFKGAGLPRTFKLFKDGELFYFRHLDGKTPRIKFNLLHVGNYTSETPFDVVKETPLEIPTALPELPPFERERLKPVRIVPNPHLTGTPARIFTEIGLIETGPDFYNFPKPIRLFILLHEKGHFFYKTEEYCDLYALREYLKRGYNRSMAFYSLSKILKRSPENIARLKFLLKNIQSTQKTKL